MRIIGGKDYYDGARAYGIDDDVVFVRHNHDKVEGVKNAFDVTRKIDYYQEDSHGRFHWTHAKSHNAQGPWIYPHYVWFCGKLYTGVKARIAQVVPNLVKHFWDINQCRQFMDQHKLKLRVRKHYWYDNDEYVNKIEDLFQIKDATAEQLDFLIDNGIAIAIWSPEFEHQNVWKFNTDGLKSVDFAKAVDPYQAFQELSMFVGGVLPRQPREIVELSGEKIMLQKHGFDKWTFKKQGTNSC